MLGVAGDDVSRPRLLRRIRRRGCRDSSGDAVNRSVGETRVAE